MFHIERFPEELRKKLFSSISFLITKSENYTRHEGYLRTMVRNITQANIADPKRPLYIELLNEILECNRLDYF